MINAGFTASFDTPTSNIPPVGLASLLMLNWSSSQDVAVPQLYGGLLPLAYGFSVPIDKASASHAPAAASGKSSITFLNMVGGGSADLPAPCASLSCSPGFVQVLQFQSCASTWVQAATVLSAPAGVRYCAARLTSAAPSNKALMQLGCRPA